MKKIRFSSYQYGSSLSFIKISASTYMCSYRRQFRVWTVYIFGFSYDYNVMNQMYYNHINIFVRNIFSWVRHTLAYQNTHTHTLSLSLRHIYSCDERTTIQHKMFGILTFIGQLQYFKFHQLNENILALKQWNFTAK